MTLAPSPRAQRLAALIRAWPRTRLPLPELWRLLDQADPSSRTDSRRRSVLAELINELTRAEVIAAPSPRSFDRTELPHLPRFVTVLRPNAAVSPAQREIVWHPELSWVPDAQLAPSQTDQLAMINTWLFRGRDDLVVPVRERSLEIFHDEKTLDRLLLTNLFTTGRLSLSTLRTRRAIPRMFTTVLGDGDTALIVENSDTFDSLTRALSEQPGRIGLIGWGAGAAFEASVLSIADLDRPVSNIRYFGDLDKAGLRIPANASQIAIASGLPPIQPASELYDALLRIGRPQPGQSSVDPPAAEQLVQWLDPAHRPRASQLLQSGYRLAQEAIGLRHLLQHEDWRSH